MAQGVLRIERLPEGALDAAAAFHLTWLPRARADLTANDTLVLVFEPAPYDHHGWRLAAVQDLAREAAPKRVNGIVGNHQPGIAETMDWLAQAPGITGQLLSVDGKAGVND